MQLSHIKSNMKMEDFDFIRVSFPDLNGVHMSKLVGREQFHRIQNNEVDLYAGAICFGPRNQYVPFPEFVENKFRNAFLFPDFKTLNPIPWSDEKFKVGEVIADMMWDNTNPVECSPRIVLKKQLALLDELGLEMYSAFEPEFRAFKSGTFEPFTTGLDLYKTSLFVEYESFFMDAVSKLSSAGVKIQDCSTEHGEGQLEMPLMPSFGIAAADECFRFKQGIKEIARKHKMTVSFMTKPIFSESSNGNHYNHSLWYKSTKTNAMYDGTKEDHLSDIARHWIGGLMKHLPSLSALCCPTMNCYSRLHNFIAPSAIDWDINNRFCSVRVKSFNEKSTYVENRLPSSAACPYHVMAATIAAGVDGIKNKIEPPPKGDKSLGTLPNTFSEALDFLDQDEILKAALGAKFVDYFVTIKRKIDCQEIPIDGCTKEDRLNKERYQYFDYI